jgi:putative peptidoglycan lipid II flippase
MSERLARSAGIVGVATMTSRLLGVVRELVLAALFGAGDAMDAFFVAFRVPNLVRDLFAEGAMSAAFVPTFTRYLTTRDRADAWHLGNLVITALFVVTGTLVVAGIVFANPLLMLMARDYAGVPGKFELAVLLTRIMLPFLTMVAIAVAMMGMLNSLRHFFVPAMSPAMFNVATIACAFLVVPAMPAVGLPPIAGIAIGTLVGGLGQILIQWPSLRREGYRFRPTIDLRDPGLREVLLLMGPGTLGLAAVQINILVNTILATGQGTGAVSYLSYAFRLMYLPIGLFGVSVATAAIPEVSRYAALGDTAGIRRTLSSSLRLMLMLNVPATIGLVALAAPTVSLIFERGRFALDHSTAPTAAALIFYAPGLVGYSAVKIASPAFYALRDSRTPVLVSVGSVVVNLALNLALVRVLGYRGLALGTAIAAIFNASLLLYLLGRRLDGLEWGRLAVALVKISIASAVMGVASFVAEASLHTVLPGGGVVLKLVRVSAAIGVGLIVLAAGARLLRLAEFDEAVQRLRVRLMPAPGSR